MRNEIDEAEARRLLLEFDAAVEKCRASSWIQSLDEPSTADVEVPVVNHGPPWDDGDENDDEGSRWEKTPGLRWVDRRHAQEIDEEWRQLRDLLENDDEREALIDANLLIVPALLGHIYCNDPEKTVPVRYYWTLVTGSHDSALAAQSTFFKLLKPSQTTQILRRAFRSGKEELAYERIWSIAAAVPHIFNLLLLDDEVTLRCLLGTKLVDFGPSHGLLEALIDIGERLFVKLGRSPFGPDDNRLHLEVLEAVARSIFEVADDLRSTPLGLSYVQRLRGIEAQFELQWPRLTLAGGPNLVTPVIKYQSTGTGYGPHPADWIRSAARELGDSDVEVRIEAMVRPAREELRRVEQHSRSRSDWSVAAQYQREFWRGSGTTPDICAACHGPGRIHCQKCDGQRYLLSDGGIGLSPSKRESSPDTQPCYYCAATGHLICWACQGTGEPPETDSDIGPFKPH